ncbi:Nn.00g014720.m01.CDS01 [Neocucurbitaria sp. VM-36]
MSHKDARKLVEAIRQEKIPNGTTGQSVLVTVLQNALDILSEQLYDKSTHFLLELLQNADDNAYKCQTPTMNLTYRPGSLRIDCNEVGFSEENVKAICSIGESTKKGLNRSSGYIGEKGIGFKSVFKVADIVWISSRQFNFKFDRSQDLGIIAPLWEDFPEPTIPGYTSFFMRLADGHHEEELMQDIRLLDPTLLVFLRRIRELNLSITRTDESIWSTRLSRTDTWESGNLVVNLSQGDSSVQYLVTKHVVNHVVNEIKRPGCLESELLLAFPITDKSNERKGAIQSVYAFLPIRSYGFRFLLQSDFLLTANREDIDKSSTWNCTLRDATTRAFVKSIESIVASALRYDWLQFVPAIEESSFFFSVQDEVLIELAYKPVLESWSQAMTSPSTLVYVPEEFLDDEGIPFSLHFATAPTYLSARYPDSEINTLKRLGVQILSSYSFLQDLDAMIKENHEAFLSKPDTWHAQLGKALLPLLAVDLHKELVSAMRIIPLKDGQWVTASKDTLFFSTGTKVLSIPDGIPLQVIDSSAEAIPHRRDLFKQLGARDYDVLEVCRAIEKRHCDSDCDATTIPREQLVSHAMYLYQASWQSEKLVNLWFATNNDGRRQGSELYMRANCRRGSPLSVIYERLEAHFDFIHCEYLDMFPDDRTAWLTWLEKVVGISTIPRIVSSPARRTLSSVLSKEFKVLFQHCNPRDVFWVIRDNWRYYSRWVENDDVAWQSVDSEGQTDRSERESLRKELKDQRIRCKIGQATLSQTVLPMVDTLMDSWPIVPTIDVYDPHSPGWKVLRHFGVAVEKNVEYYVRCLEALQNMRPSHDILIHIYDQLRNMLDQYGEIIRAVFRLRRLIYASTRQRPGLRVFAWYTSAECLTGGLQLENDYPTCIHFFSYLLTKDGGGLDSLLTKMSFIDRSNTVSGLSKLFQDLNNAIRERTRTRTFIMPHHLRVQPIFPITRTGTKGTFDYLAPVGPETSWLIADRRYLRDNFCGKIPLLAFSPEETDSMDFLFRSFQIDRRKLSLRVKVQTIPRGLTSVHGSYTSFLKERVPFIQALIPSNHMARGEVMRRIANIQASTSTEILHHYAIRVGNKDVIATSDDAELASTSTKKMLRVFMTEECISADCPSFDLVELIADHCSISLPKHRSLLFTALSEESVRRIKATFSKQGVHVEIVVPDHDSVRLESLADRYAGASGDLPIIPSAFSARKGNHRTGQAANHHDVDDERSDGIQLTTTDHILEAERPQLKGGAETKKKRANTRLPFSTVKAEGAALAQPTFVYWPINELVDTNTHYLGELMKYLGSVYDPTAHWTSQLRARAGYGIFHDSTEHASFTFTGQAVSSMITQILATYGYSDALFGRLINPTYHFEVAVTPHDQSESFHVHLAQFERVRVTPSTTYLKLDIIHLDLADIGFHKMRRYQYTPEGPSPAHVVVLARLSNIYTNLRYEFHINPWRLYASNHLSLHGQCSFEVKFSAQSSLEVPRLLESSRNTSPLPKSTGTLSPPPNSDSYFNSTTSNSSPPIVSHTMLAKDRECNINQIHSRPTAEENAQVFPLQAGSTIVGLPEPGHYPQYLYKHLQNSSIRLLHLLPDSGDDSLRGIIFHVPLESAIQFRALSYVWGTMSQTEALWTPDGVLGITPNLKAALQHLRQKKDSLILWVDAICINQHNMAEKALQIRLLPDIFQRATSVFAYLGNDRQNHRAIETLMQIRAKGALSDWPKCLPPVPSSWGTQPIPAATDPVWDDIKNFFQNSWFRRAWVVQEVVLAASVRIVCSKWIVDWNDLLSAVNTVHREYRRAGNIDAPPDVYPWEFFLELAQHREWEARQTRWALINLFEPFRYLESTWKRDRLFALLGIASDGADPAFEPDYTSPLEVVVTRFANVFIRQGKVLQLLYRAGLGSQPERFPSWVPDWTSLKPTSLYESSARGMAFCASWISKPEAEHDQGSDELRIRGFRLGSLQHVTKATNTPDQWSTYWSEIDVMMNSGKIKTSYSTKDRAEMERKVPIVGALYPKTMAGGNINMEASYETFRCELMLNDMNQPRTGNTTSDAGDNYRLALEGNICGWRFFTTQGGFVGLGPPNTMAGDLVYVLNGASVPFLLRRSATRTGAYRLVGECYVHGLMNGEGGKMSPEDEGFIHLH